MKRQITIYESAKNGKITVFNDVECNTLGELKQLLREKGIEYSDKEFIEGVTNTKLMGDDSQIPTNIPFKDRITNDVFINILNKDTKIKSGVSYTELSRADLLRAAKPYAQEIEASLGVNYTRAKSTDIAYFLQKKELKDAQLKPADLDPKETVKKEEVGVEAKLEMLKKAVEYLAEQSYLEDEIEDIFKNWNGMEHTMKHDEPKSNFTTEDIQAFIRK